jgi:hypothetical protein
MKIALHKKIKTNYKVEFTINKKLKDKIEEIN